MSDASVLAINMGTVFSIGFATLVLVLAGYKMGVNQSRRMARKCNRDHRRLEKWEKKLLKEQKKLEKQMNGLEPVKRFGLFN